MHKSKKERIIVKFFFGGEAKFGAEGSSRRFIELATKDTRVQGVRMFVPRTVETAKKIYNEALEHHKSMRSLDAVFEAELSKRDFKTEGGFAEWLRDNSTEVKRNLKRIGDEYLEEVGGEKWDIDDAELERRENLWLKNNLTDLQRLYGAKIETPNPKPAGEYGAEGNGGSFGSRSQLSQSMKEVRAQYTNADKTMRLDYMRAPNGNATNLTEAQWLQFRTPEFKEKYGDWETLARINEVSKMPAEELLPAQKSDLSNSEIEQLFESFGNVENKRNGNFVKFANASIGKIVGHKTEVPLSEMIDSFKKLFEDSVLIINEKEILKPRHKRHSNFKGYEHYVNKFIYNNKPYYIRFTVPVENAKPQTIANGYIPRKVHSTMVTDVSIYGESPQSSTNLSTSGTKGTFFNGDSSVVSAYNNAQSDVSISGKGESSQFVDGKLLDFLSSVKKKDIKIPLDENGEPIPEVVQPDGEFGAEGYEGAKASFTPYGNDSIGKRIGTVDPQGRFAPERFAPASQTHAADTVEAYRKLNDMVKIADDINGGTPPELAAKLASQIDVWKTKLDSKMLNLPDLVELANSLMTQPVGVRRRIGRALGVFEHSPYSSTIRIRTDMFEWVNDAERFALAERAADRTLETASGKMKGIAVAVSDGAVVRTWFVNKIQGINVEREN